MKKFDNEILELKIPKGNIKDGILECNDKKQFFFANLNTYDIQYIKEKNEYKFSIKKNGKETFGPKILDKKKEEIDQEFKNNFIQKYRDYVKSLKESNEKLENELKFIIDKNNEIKKINEKISKKLIEVEKLQKESLANSINDNN